MKTKQKTLITSMIGVVMAVMLAVPMAGCSMFNSLFMDEEAAQKQVVTQFVDACSNMDVEGMMACCDSDTNKLFEGASSLLSSALSVAGQNNADVNNIISQFLPQLKQYLSAANSNVTLTTNEVQITKVDDTHATAKVTIGITASGSNASLNKTVTQDLNLVNEGGQ